MPSVRSLLVCANVRSKLREKVSVRQGRRLVDDRVRLGLEHGPAHGRAIEQIERDRLGAERPYVFRFLGRRRGADHLMASVDELGDQPGADRTARSCNEDSHRVLLWSHRPRRAGLLL